jgi:hypothetical protein
LLGPIYRTLEWMGLLAISKFYFLVSRVEVSLVLDFNSNNQMREGGRLPPWIGYTLVGSQWKNSFLDPTCVVPLF